MSPLAHAQAAFKNYKNIIYDGKNRGKHCNSQIDSKKMEESARYN